MAAPLLPLNRILGDKNTEQYIKTYAWLLSLIPLAMLALGIWQIIRTRRKSRWGKVKTSCVFTANMERNSDHIVQTGPESLLVEAVNHGPGEVTILSLKGRYKDGSIHDITLQNSERKLRQGDRIARAIMPIEQLGGQFDGFFNQDGMELVDIWFEDTFGRKHKLKHAKRFLQAMREMM